MRLRAGVVMCSQVENLFLLELHLVIFSADIVLRYAQHRE